MSAPLRDSSQMRCLTPAVERVIAWHRQRLPLIPPTDDDSVDSDASVAQDVRADDAAHADAMPERDPAAPVD